ncbi:UBX domain-containing protein [Metarhizium album ARSEF 1941]|uniref:UBX domain-containing protein n=1 Tax=Metarhizium album (strain ARSEF 1941) TaxID=1081103 RepID=A0A0B2WM01_METAS|nr:UBX domain-containing protein [Metarhizium album ARSEF 1941]KHN94973.1 UBX domain-containing protein [Metarhizium album ARSEF 1941]
MADNQDTPNREKLVQEFTAMCNCSPDEATQYLDAHQWDLPAACNSFFQDDDEARLQSGSGDSRPEPSYTGPRTLDGRPAPADTSSGRGGRPPTSQPKRRGVATLGSLGGASHSHDDGDDDDDDDEDDDEEGRGDLYAGGGKSGLAVQDPHQGDQRKIIKDMLAQAKANASRPDQSADEPGPSAPSRFRGAGVTLGGEGVESRRIPDPLGSLPASSAAPEDRILHIWQDGFSIDDGELRRFDDPANQADLQMIKSGRAPLHLMNVQYDQRVDVKLHRHATPYQQPLKKYTPFSGAGQRLGSPVPGVGSLAPRLASTATASTSSVSASTSPEPSIDSSQPTVMIRIQMPDGTRLPARFNTTNTVGDVYGFVQRASPDIRTRSWVLATTFPNKEHTDKDLVLGDMAEFKKGGTAVVKWT